MTTQFIPLLERGQAQGVFRSDLSATWLIAVLACKDRGVDHLVIGGGVAANSRLRAVAQERCDRAGIVLRVPRPGLCTDNGAMVAALGAEMVARDVEPSSLELAADPSLALA